MNVFRGSPSLVLLYTRKEITKRVQELAQALSHSFADREPVVVGVLKGAFLFVADLVREMTVPVKVDFVQVASYGSGTESAGTVHLMKDLSLDIEGKDVILADTILDTGLTLRFLRDKLSQRYPRSLTTCMLLDKRRHRHAEVEADYVGFTLSDGFVVGYGLDYGESYRDLPGLYVVRNIEVRKGNT